MKYLLSLLVILTSLNVYADPLTPADITAYEFRFSRVEAGVIPADTDKYYLGGTMTLSWFVPTETMPYDIQPEPVLYSPILSEFVLAINPADVSYGESDGTYVFAGSGLSVGDWQVQIRASRDVDGVRYWSKYSNSVPFVATVEPEPPAQMQSITIRFAR